MGNNIISTIKELGKFGNVQHFSNDSYVLLICCAYLLCAAVAFYFVNQKGNKH